MVPHNSIVGTLHSNTNVLPVRVYASRALLNRYGRKDYHIMKIVVTGAGSAQSNGVINCLRMGNDNDEILGFGSDRYDLMLCNANKKYLVPHSSDPKYQSVLLDLLKQIRPDMIHIQHDRELITAMGFRDQIEALGIKMLIPDYNTIDTCVHKFKSRKKFKDAGIRVPENIYINTPDDLKVAFQTLGTHNGTIWLRSTSVGGGGLGSLAAHSYEEAYEWIEQSNGWGCFLAAELLSQNTVTWLSIWYKGELIVAQGRRRHGWAHSALSASGVTGVTKIGSTYSDVRVDDIGKKACLAVSQMPHGIYGVDMAYDFDGSTNPTEINLATSFTTVQFFAEAGLNMPMIYKDLCLYGQKPNIKTCNPLPDGLLWIRGMDCTPVLTTEEEIQKTLIAYGE